SISDCSPGQLSTLCPHTVSFSRQYLAGFHQPCYLCFSALFNCLVTVSMRVIIWMSSSLSSRLILRCSLQLSHHCYCILMVNHVHYVR
ncbi:hypothetical protein L9F63_023865, partial [Diploptera punctata]